MKLVLIATTLGLLWGCQSTLKHQPALLAESSRDSSAQIKTIIEQALNADNVLISQSVFSESSLLIIQRQPAGSFDSPQLFSETELPNHFMLLKNTNGCLIRHKQSQTEWYLKNIDCINAEKW